MESLNDENFLKKVILKVKGEIYLFSIDPIFSTLGSIMEISISKTKNSFEHDDSIQNLVGFDPAVIYENYNQSHNPNDIFSFESIFLETDVAQTMIFQVKSTGKVHNFVMDADPGYSEIEKSTGGIQWHKMESKDFISKISFQLKKWKW